MMKKSAPNYRFLLRVVAGKLEKGLLSKSEKVGLAKMLRMLGEGLTLNEIFNIETKPHRPQGMELEKRIFDLAVLQLPKKHGGSGLTKTAAIEKIANEYSKSVSTIESDYKSARGKKMRQVVKNNYYNPLQVDDLNSL